MTRMNRYAVYFAPRPSAFATRSAEWLGWDALRGAALVQPDLPGLPLPPAQLTTDSRRYGFHGTIRAPFRLAKGVGEAEVRDCLSALAARLAPVTCDGLMLKNLHGFLALTPMGCEAALLDLAALVVEGTDDLRATLTSDEIARRRPQTLSPRQRDLLELWGYPFVMEEFRFHLTLTDRLPDDQATKVATILQAHFAPVLPQPFVIEDLCLFGEDVAGRFHLLHRDALTG
ncbi:MAG: DUF1045 domain-containing protein [Tabrizicola sp.]|nr:DUF1045 domain-containing protein [Tabrizicola sp.]